ncbi:MAG TPA: asparagine synthase (glutamine-hydrolyzing) [bacterium]|nr:asparagine synthase (glutamine-hydrolyzing) [bacterium]
MCGIIGTFDRRSETPRRVSQEEVGNLRHRGPDAYGIYNDGPISLGHRRLSILDLTEGGAQPQSTRDGRYTVTFNGEIYNYIELRHELAGQGITFHGASDTEVLLAAYRVWGRDCVARFRGMFAFALYDREARTLFMARDRCGEKPFFFYRDADRFFFASELKGLLPLLPRTPSLNPSAIDLYLHYQYVPEPFTLLEGVRKLPAAHTLLLSCDDWDAEPVRYWDVRSAADPEYASVRPGDIPDIIRGRLEESVALTLRSDVPVGLALSGGIDSGAIAALARRHTADQFHAFGVGYPGRPPYDEREQAKELAQRLGITFHEVELRTDDFVDFLPTLVGVMDEPIADIAAFGHYAVPRAAAEHGIKVLLSGTGGDEVFWGYPWVVRSVEINEFLFRHPLVSRLRHLPKGLWRYEPLWKACSHSRLINTYSTTLREIAELDMDKPSKQFFFYEMVKDFVNARLLHGEVYGPAMRDISADNVFLPTAITSRTGQDVPAEVVRLLFDTWLVSNCLTLGDRVAMGCGVEVRLPFLDARLIESVMTLRRSCPDHQLGHKAWLRAALKNVLPENVLSRPKAGFQPPIIDWLDGARERYQEMIRSGHLVAAGIFDAALLERFLKETGKEDYYRLFFLYKIILLEIWNRSVVQRHTI